MEKPLRDNLPHKEIHCKKSYGLTYKTFVANSILPIIQLVYFTEQLQIVLH